jgi:hypothetical protein
MKEMGLEKRSNPEILARIAYAVYCGGPAQLHSSAKRLVKGIPNAIDKLFHEKYQWVCNNQWEKIEICL